MYTTTCHISNCLVVDLLSLLTDRNSGDVLSTDNLIIHPTVTCSLVYSKRGTNGMRKTIISSQGSIRIKTELWSYGNTYTSKNLSLPQAKRTKLLISPLKYLKAKLISPLLLSTGWFQARIPSWFHSRTDIYRGFMEAWLKCKTGPLV